MDDPLFLAEVVPLQQPWVAAHHQSATVSPRCFIMNNENTDASSFAAQVLRALNEAASKKHSSSSSHSSFSSSPATSSPFLPTTPPTSNPGMIRIRNPFIIGYGTVINQNLLKRPL